MDREQFSRQIEALRRQGGTVRGIAAELGVPKGRVERSLRRTSRRSQGETPRASGPFVGRQTEMDALISALDSAQGRRGRIVLIAGEPGIGKTRMAQELATSARDRGFQAFWGRCSEVSGAPPYWPWIQVIRSLTGGQKSDESSAGSRGLGHEIAALVPEINDGLSGVGPTVGDSLEANRFRLFDAVATLLKGACANQPLLLIVEDIHRGDMGSLLFLQYLAGEISESRLMVLATYRDVEVSRDHPLQSRLGELARADAIRLRLPPLRLLDVRQFVEVSTGEIADEDAVCSLHSRSGGNPLFMVELLRLFRGLQDSSSSPGFSPAELAFPIPDTVRDVIRRRLGRLSQRSAEVLTHAAVIGRDFSLDQLAWTFDDARNEELLSDLDDPLEARLIERAPSSAGRFQFTHVLIQETLVTDLPGARRASLHAGIGSRLEQFYGADLPIHAAELAGHFAWAAPLIGPARLARYSLMAGERALATFAHEEAIAHLERGLQAKQGQAVDGETADLLLGLGRAQMAVFERPRLQEAVDKLGRALDYYIAAGDVHKIAAVADIPEQKPVQGFTRFARLADRALFALPPDSHPAGRIWCRYGLALGYEEGDSERAFPALERATAIARRFDDLALEMRSLANAAILLMAKFSLPESREMSTKAIELAKRLGDPHTEVIGRQYAAATSQGLGDLESATAHATAMLPLAGKLRIRHSLVIAQTVNNQACDFRGDWRGARAFNEQGLALSRQDPSLLALRVLVALQTGDFAEADAYLQRLLDGRGIAAAAPSWDYAYVAYAIPIAAMFTGDLSRLSHARDAAHLLLESSSTIPLRQIYARFGLAMIAVLGRDASAATTQYEALKHLRSLFLPVTGSVSCFDRLLALLARTTGEFDVAFAHFDDAVGVCRNAGARPELAWTLHDYAETLVSRDLPGDPGRAIALVSESVDLAQALGMNPLVDRLANLRSSSLEGKLNTEDAAFGSRSASLTPRELEVLSLIAGGKSNLEIAADLVLSVRTVERHITHVYTKIDVTNRASATAFALAHGLARSHPRRDYASPGRASSGHVGLAAGKRDAAR